MKRMQKWTSLLLVLLLALALAAPAAAAPPQPEEDQALAALGGVPGQINVLFNDKCLSFPDARPVIDHGRTMVPLRAVMEGMGAEVGYGHASRTVTVTGEAASFTHVVGTKTITLSDGAVVEMDVASYTDHNRTMVPVRFFSQVLGYDVSWARWDDTTQLVQVWDPAWVIAQIDSQFTVLNEIIALQNSRAKVDLPCEGDLTFTGTATVHDDAAGSKTYRLSGDFNVLAGEEAINLSGEMDLGDLMDALTAEVPAEELPAWLMDGFDPLTFEMILAEKGMWLKAPVLSALMQEAGLTIPGPVWMAMPADQMGLSGMTALYAETLQAQDDTLGESLYRLCKTMCTEDELYDELDEIVSVLSLIMADDTFTRSGGGYRWHLGEKELAAMMEAAGAEGGLAEAGLKAFTADMTVRADGSADFSMVLETAADAASGTPAVRMDLTGSAAGTKETVKGTLTVENVVDVNFDLNAAVRSADKEPLTQPPAGEAVIDLSAPEMPAVTVE